MKRRAFLQWLAAGAATLGAAGEIDYEKLLWVPGQKKIFLPSETVFVPTPSQVDKILATIDPTYRTPRYTLTTREHGTMLFDENWQLMNGKEIESRGKITREELDHIQRGLNAPRHTQRIPMDFGILPKRNSWETDLMKANRAARARLGLQPGQHDFEADWES